MHNITRVGLAIVAAFAFTACSSPPSAEVGPVPLPGPVMLSFGQNFTWATQDSVTVDNPRRQQEKSSITDGTAGSFLVFDVTVHNGTDQVEPTSDYLTMVTVNDINANPAAMRGYPEIGRAMNSIPPDGTLKWSESYPLPSSAPANVMVQVSGSGPNPVRTVVFYRTTV